MKISNLVYPLLFMNLIVISSCIQDGAPVKNPADQDNFTQKYGFHESWAVDFADYPTDGGKEYELFWDLTDAPDYLNYENRCLFISGNNRSDDLFMFAKRKISGLRPHSSYSLSFNLQIASNAKTDDCGVGGAPGKDVFVKIGATQKEPLKTIDKNNMYRMNIDKGNQSVGGSDMAVAGNLLVADNGCEFISKDFYYDDFTVRTNARGELWLIVGTDSGFESKSSVYYMFLEVEFTEK